MDTIDSILQAAYELISERGFERTPVSDIAKRAGVAAGTVIYHFKTKKNLLRVLNWFTLNRLYSDLRQHTLNAADGLAATNLYIDRYFSFVSSQRREVTLLMETYSHSRATPDNAEAMNMDINIQTIRGGLGDLLETLIREGSADGSIRPMDARKASMGILAMLIGSARLILFHDMQSRELLTVAHEFVQAHLEPK